MSYKDTIKLVPLEHLTAWLNRHPEAVNTKQYKDYLEEVFLRTQPTRQKVEDVNEPKVIVTNDAGTRWGFAPVEWAAFEIAPLTASGLNEIFAVGKTKKEVVQVALFLGKKVTLRGQYQVTKLENVRKEL